MSTAASTSISPRRKSKMTLLSLQKQMRRIVENTRAAVDSLEGSNPQTVSIRERMKAEIDLAEAIDRAISNDPVDLNLYLRRGV